VPQKPSALVQNGPIDPASKRGPVGPPSSTYGPPQGLGISGSGGLPMPEGSSSPPSLPRGAPTGPGPGGPLSHP
jgi:hypothetical protein